MEQANKQKRKRGKAETLVVLGWFVAFIAFQIAFRGLGFLDALSQFLTPINVVLSAVVIFGGLGVMAFMRGMRKK